MSSMVWYTMWCHRWDHIARPMILNRCSFETCALPLYITSSSLFWALLSCAPSSQLDLDVKNISTPCFELKWARRNELKVAQNPRFCAQSQSANALLRQKKSALRTVLNFDKEVEKIFWKLKHWSAFHIHLLSTSNRPFYWLWNLELCIVYLLLQLYSSIERETSAIRVVKYIRYPLNTEAVLKSKLLQSGPNKSIL